jgi:hypothetical protein
MPVPSKADGNVPFIGSRKRYSILGLNLTWIYHRMAGGASLNGAAPKTASLEPNAVDPTVSAGRAEFTALTEGGLFTLLGNYRRPVLVESVDNAAGATLTIVDKNNVQLRTAPLKMAPGEYFKAAGGSAGSHIGILVRDEGTEL